MLDYKPDPEDLAALPDALVRVVEPLVKNRTPRTKSNDDLQRFTPYAAKDLHQMVEEYQRLTQSFRDLENRMAIFSGGVRMRR